MIVHATLNTLYIYHELELCIILLATPAMLKHCYFPIRHAHDGIHHTKLATNRCMSEA